MTHRQSWTLVNVLKLAYLTPNSSLILDKGKFSYCGFPEGWHMTYYQSWARVNSLNLANLKDDTGLIADERHQPQANEANCNDVECWIRLKSSCFPPVTASPHEGQIKRLWGKRLSWEFSMQLSMRSVVRGFASCFTGQCVSWCVYRTVCVMMCFTGQCA